MASDKKVKNFIIDVDGVLTDGSYFYTVDGKIMKAFGPDDSDALNLLRPYMNIIMISGDKKGFGISKRRIVDDMGFQLEAVSTFERAKWIEDRFNPKETIYMGDGIFDAGVFEIVGYGIAPANAFYKTREKADFVTSSPGGNSAVAEAVIHIMENFFDPVDLTKISLKDGEWGNKKS